MNNIYVRNVYLNRIVNLSFRKIINLKCIDNKSDNINLQN